MQYCRGMGNYGIVIFGKGFGDTPGSKIVKNGLYKLESVYWTDTEVDAQLTPNQVNFWSNNYIYLYDPGIKKMISNKVPIVLVPVHLGGFYPNENAKPGTEIKLDGCFFGAIQGQRKLKFGNSIVPTTSWKDNLIIFTVPSLSPGRYDVYIEESNKRISNKRFFHIQ